MKPDSEPSGNKQMRPTSAGVIGRLKGRTASARASQSVRPDRHYSRLNVPLLSPSQDVDWSCYPPIRRVRARPIWRALAASQGTASSGVRRSPALAKGRNAGIGGRRRVPQPERTPHHLTPSRPRPRPAHHGIEPARGGTAPGSRPDGRFRPMSSFDGAEPIGSFFSQHADLIEFPL